MTQHATNPINGVQLFFQNYFNFNDIATRGDYWWNFLGQCIIVTGLLIIASLVGNGLGTVIGLFLLLYTIACVVPDVSMAVRRLRGLGFGDNGLILVLMTILYEAIGLARLVINLIPNTVDE